MILMEHQQFENLLAKATRHAQDTILTTHLCCKTCFFFQGLVTVPFWVYWTSPNSSHGIDHIPNGWVMFNGGHLMTHVEILVIFSGFYGTVW